MRNDFDALKKACLGRVEKSIGGKIEKIEKHIPKKESCPMPRAKKAIGGVGKVRKNQY